MLAGMERALYFFLTMAIPRHRFGSMRSSVSRSFPAVRQARKARCALACIGWLLPCQRCIQRGCTNPFPGSGGLRSDCIRIPIFHTLNTYISILICYNSAAL
jgi:hypothetical protein